jgi:hypothetical protein
MSQRCPGLTRRQILQPTGKLPCMDRLQEDLSCAIKGIHLVVVQSVVAILMMMENDLGIVFFV